MRPRPGSPPWPAPLSPRDVDGHRLFVRVGKIRRTVTLFMRLPREDAMPRSHQVFGVVLLASLVATGCATGRVRLASSKSCQAHGGTYDAGARTCGFERGSKHAAAICQDEGGYYDPNADFCELGRD